jgi:hypothetical protein
MKPFRPTKRRGSYVYIGCTEKFDRVDVTDDSFLLPDDGKTYYIFHQREYPREQKPKVIYALFPFFGARVLKKDPFDELRKYDRIFAIDTNYRERAITTAIVAAWSRSRSRLNSKIMFTRPFVPTSNKPEREAWKSFIEQADVGQHDRCNLIVDSDLGELAKINRREIPIFDGFLLPETWQLNYATSDVSDPFPAVQMMRQCDAANRRHGSGV